MKIKFIVFAIIISCFHSNAQSVRFITLTVSGNRPTNYFSTSQSEAAELVSFQGSGGISVIKDEILFNAGTPADGFSGGHGTIVQGPATYKLATQGGSCLITLKITTQITDPNKTFILPPGTNQVQVTLQVSPDLANWTTATNGIYGNPNTAQFFRIKEDILTPP